MKFRVTHNTKTKNYGPTSARSMYFSHVTSFCGDHTATLRVTLVRKWPIFCPSECEDRNLLGKFKRMAYSEKLESRKSPICSYFLVPSFMGLSNRPITFSFHARVTLRYGKSHAAQSGILTSL